MEIISILNEASNSNKLAKMNLAILGISANLGDVPAIHF